MSRATELKQVVKRKLEDLNFRGLNSSEIYHALNRGQSDIAVRYDLIKTQITINTIIGQAAYDLFVKIGSTVTAGSFVTGTIYQIVSVGTTDFTLIGAASNNVGVVFTATGAGSGTGTAKQAVGYVRKITSMQIPTTWNKLYYKTDQQLDEILSNNASVTTPTYFTVRNKQLVFHSAPTIDDESIVLQVSLYRQSQDMSDSIEPEIDSYFDECLETYAVWFLLPESNPLRQNKRQEYEFLVADLFGKSADNYSAPIVPKARW